VRNRHPRTSAVGIRCSVYHIIPRRENALAVSLLWSSLKVMGRDERNINLALCITARERERERSALHQRQQTLFFPWDSSAIFTSFEHPHYPRVYARTRSSRQNLHTPFRWGCCVRCALPAGRPAGWLRALFFISPHSQKQHPGLHWLTFIKSIHHRVSDGTLCFMRGGVSNAKSWSANNFKLLYSVRLFRWDFGKFKTRSVQFLYLFHYIST
jgi:hypothetical protein